MPTQFSSKNLEVKTSTLPGSGNGLFTKVFIPKGTLIIEYKGKITSWAEANHNDGTNAYLYYLNRHHVIDASKHLKSLARFANDARGLTRINGLVNNCGYTVTEDRRVFIIATKDIKPGAEILVNYGKEYWDVIKKYLQESFECETRPGSVQV